MIDEFQSGPFRFAASDRGRMINRQPQKMWHMFYGDQLLTDRSLPADMSATAVHDAFADDVSAFVQKAHVDHAPARVYLIDAKTDERIAHIDTDSMLGMTPGIIDDRSRYWLTSKNRRYSRDVTLTQFVQLAVEHATPARAWITGLLPDDVLATEAGNWRAPTSWEIRHIVGEGSLTGASGAAAAALVGVTPQNFRKYTAREGSASRQNISYAMWHLLLKKLEVTR